MSTLRLSGIIRESIVDGPGIRFVVFTQGCPHHCPGCHNPQTWPFSGGFETTPEKIFAEIIRNPLLRGVTFSGGEPFCQPEGLAELAQMLHNHGLNVITYTGYTFEELIEKSNKEPGILPLLQQTDILIDGRFIQKKKSYDLSYTGSSNQRIIDVKRSLEKGEAVIAEI
jgi:anaerobic ribonucleoside-triphosphate reductase activating protein